MGRVIGVCVLAVLGLSAGGGALGEESQLPLGEQAKKAYETAMSPYRSGNYTEALGLLKEFIKTYPTNENVPLAYIELAKCQDRQKDTEGYDATLEQVIKKFPGSGTWFVATSWKLARLKALKKNDEYLAALEALARTCKEVPMDAAFGAAEMDWGSGGNWYYRQEGSIRVRFYRLGFSRSSNVDALFRSGVERDLLEVCDTPERAEHALHILSGSFKKNGKELSPNWQFTHIGLLKKAGHGPEAAKTLQAYKDEWGASDPRGMFLLVLVGEDAQQNHDDAAADATYDELVKKYGTDASFAEVIDVRLNYLLQQKRSADWSALAGFYLKEFPYGRLRDNLLRYFMQNTVALIAKGDANAQAQGQDILDKHLGGNDSYFGIQWRTEVALATKNYDQAAKTAQLLADDKYWSAGTYGLLTQWGGRNAALKKISEDARTKHAVFLPEANSPANALLTELKARAKEEQVRHMEEIGKELLEKYPHDAAAVEGVKLLVDYYYGKVLAEPRDRWIAAMIASYPKHPLTQAVMGTQINALSAAKQYAQQLAALRAMLAAFPGVVYENYALNDGLYRQCMTCFDLLHDAAGRLDFVQKHYAAAIAKGDPQAIGHLVASQIKDPNDQRANGQLWLNQAKAVAGTRTEVYCLQRACETYYPEAYHERHLVICRKEGMNVIHKLQEQKTDPEAQWQTEFLEVNLLADNGNPKAALALLDKKLTARKYRDLYQRLDFEILANSVNQPKETQAAEAVRLALKMEKLCYTTGDALAVGQFCARMCQAHKESAEAVRRFMKLVDDCPWPAARYGVFSQAMDCTDVATVGGPCEDYIARIPHVQDIVPKIMLKVALIYLKAKDMGACKSYGNRLASDYPASGALAELQAAVAAAEAPKAPPGK